MEHLNKYQYKGFWIEVFLESNSESSQFEDQLFDYYASVELGGNRGCITTGLYSDKENAEFAAEELIESWN